MSTPILFALLFAFVSLCVLFHFLSVFSGARAAKVFSYVNICLHIPLLILLLLLNVTLEIVCILLMSSFIFRLVLSSLRYALSKKVMKGEKYDV